MNCVFRAVTLDYDSNQTVRVVDRQIWSTAGTKSRGSGWGIEVVQGRRGMRTKAQRDINYLTHNHYRVHNGTCSL